MALNLATASEIPGQATGEPAAGRSLCGQWAECSEAPGKCPPVQVTTAPRCGAVRDAPAAGGSWTVKLLFQSQAGIYHQAPSGTGVTATQWAALSPCCPAWGLPALAEIGVQPGVFRQRGGGGVTRLWGLLARAGIAPTTCCMWEEPCGTCFSLAVTGNVQEHPGRVRGGGQGGTGEGGWASRAPGWLSDPTTPVRSTEVPLESRCSTPRVSAQLKDVAVTPAPGKVTRSPHRGGSEAQTSRGAGTVKGAV